MRRSALALLCLGFVGCSNKLEGTLEVDGATFKPTSCRSLQPMGMMGVELEADDGTRFRFAERADGGGEALYFESGKKKGKRLGECVNLTVGNQNSTINNVRNVEGKAVVDCSEPKVKGTIAFKNCH